MNTLCERCEAQRRATWPEDYRKQVEENRIDDELFNQLVAEEMERWKDLLERLAKGPGVE